MSELTREQILKLKCNATWDFGQRFFFETEIGNFIWKDPDMGGDNSIVKTSMSLEEFCMPMGRDKGNEILIEEIVNPVLRRNRNVELFENIIKQIDKKTVFNNNAKSINGILQIDTVNGDLVI